jgi:uncharacterized protein YcaQ
VVTISPVVARRFILGKSGLWPGRRWQGEGGIAAAVDALTGVQVDPLLVTFRNHDLALYSRIVGYQPDQLHALAYERRQYFDYGGMLCLYPMAELPHWRVHMAQHREDPWWGPYFAENAALLDEIRAAVRARGPIGHRDLESKNRVDSYHARKDTGLGLYALWRVGELMTSGRQRFDRLYDFTEKIAPPALHHSSTPEEADAFFESKAVRWHGLATLPEWRGMFGYFTRRSALATQAKLRLDTLVEAGTVQLIQVEGRRDPRYMLAADEPLLAELIAGKTPDAWTPLETDTNEEVTFLAPLDPVSARGRAAHVFDGYDYKWEVYVPAPKRRWGYYVLPILYGDALVARADFKLDRPAKTLRILNFLLENPATGSDTGFAAALARGLARFAAALGAEQIDLGPVQPAALRKARLYKPYGVKLLSQA